MGSSQMLLAIGAMLLLSVIILRVNTSVFTTDEITISSEANTTALSMAQAIVADASAKRFDERTTGTYKALNNVNKLVSVAKLGPDKGEFSPEKYDDFDDYNNYSTTIDGYKIDAKVHYLNPTKSDINVVSTKKSFYKLLTVSVTSPLLNSDSTKDVITASKVFGYWPSFANGKAPVIKPSGSSSSSSGSSSGGGSSSSSSSSSTSSSGSSSSSSGSSTSSSTSSSGGGGGSSSTSSSSSSSSSGSSSSSTSSGGKPKPKPKPPPIFLR